MRPRRSFILIAMLLVVGTALLVVTTIVFMAQADAAGAAGVRERTQSRLLAWSGIQAISVRLDEQRRRILDGERPSWTRSTSSTRTGGARAWFGCCR